MPLGPLEVSSKDRQTHHQARSLGAHMEKGTRKSVASCAAGQQAASRLCASWTFLTHGKEAVMDLRRWPCVLGNQGRALQL